MAKRLRNEAPNSTRDALKAARGEGRATPSPIAAKPSASGAPPKSVNVDDDDRPRERSARVRPRTAIPTSTQRALEAAGGATPRRRAALDPRFDPLYGDLNPNAFKQHYAHVEQQQQAEFEELAKRLRELRLLRRKLFDSDYDEAAESDGDDDEGTSIEALEERLGMFLEADDIDVAIGEAQRKVNAFRMQMKQRKALEAKRAVAKGIHKKEVEQVKRGEKLRPFFPKRGELKQKIEEERFNALDAQGGQARIHKFLEKQSKRQTPFAPR